IVSSGGSEIVSTGGAARKASVLDTGSQDVFGIALSTTISAHDTPGVQFVEAGGTARVTTITDRVAQQRVQGGTAISTTITDGAEQIISGPGAVAISTTISSLGEISEQVIDSGGTASITVVKSN